MSVMLSAFWLMGCGNDVESAGNTESVIEEVETNDSQTIEMDSKEQSAEKEVEDSSSEITEDYNYIESEDLYFIPASNEPSGRACTASWRMPRGSNTPLLCSVARLIPRCLQRGI